MKVILVDDEHLALSYMEHQLRKVSQVEILGKFADPFEVKRFVLEKDVDVDVDVVFLDIHLPEIDGIELAEQLLQDKPRLNVVFVTAYDEYAIKAFELNALDYVMKPVPKERLEITLRRIQERLDERTKQEDLRSEEGKRLNIRLFRQFRIESSNREPLQVRWRTTKAQELFLYLLQHRGQLVRKSVLVDLLWPEYEPARAYSQLYTAVYHIRKTLEPYSGIMHINSATDGYVLQLANAELDVEAWDRFVQSGTPLDEGTVADFEEALDLYQGDYLQDDEYWWAESERYRLKSSWLRIASQLAEWHAAHGNPERAIEGYQLICDRNPLAEEAHFALMKLYASQDKRALVLRQYRRLEEVLAEEFNEPPSPSILQWYRDWSLTQKSLPQSSS
ncbi:MAG: response regulator [Paenibacillus sp.]|uniref:response regulator n=1 Tax=Paenibacillus sp. TaxID=58172 RepID=UPI0029046B5C|nr:response regulator [Paenibacillus sp.]MDU2243077.1 response regulator [Paenibacillus sp.]